MHMSAIAQWFHLFLVVIKPISAGKKIISRLDVNDPFKCEHIGQMSLPVNCIRGSLLKTPGLGRLTNSFWNECCLEHCPPLLTYQVFPPPCCLPPIRNYFRLWHTHDPNERTCKMPLFSMTLLFHEH